MMKSAKLFAAIAGTTVLAAAASGAVHTFAPFNATVSDSLNTTALPAVPAGSWNFYKFQADWSAVSGGPYSSEAEAGIWSVDDAQYLTLPFESQYGANFDSLPTMLRWEGALAIPLTGGEPLEFDALQTFSGSTAQWDNITITFQTSPDAMFSAGSAIAGPTSTDLGTQGSAGDSFSIDSLGSDFDTELALYNQAGELLATNDDYTTLQSLIQAAVYDGATNTLTGGFEAGTYYVALGGYNSSFSESGFGATGGTATGNYELALGGSVLSTGTLGSGEIHWFSFEIVPTPGTAGLLAMGGLIAARRRRSA